MDRGWIFSDKRTSVDEWNARGVVHSITARNQQTATHARRDATAVGNWDTIRGNARMGQNRYKRSRPNSDINTVHRENVWKEEQQRHLDTETGPKVSF